MNEHVCEAPLEAEVGEKWPCPECGVVWTSLDLASNIVPIRALELEKPKIIWWRTT